MSFISAYRQDPELLAILRDMENEREETPTVPNTNRLPPVTGAQSASITHRTTTTAETPMQRPVGSDNDRWVIEIINLYSTQLQ